MEMVTIIKQIEGETLPVEWEISSYLSRACNRAEKLILQNQENITLAESPSCKQPENSNWKQNDNIYIYI